MPETAERAEVVRRRIAFERDPGGFGVAWAAEEAAECARLRSAQALLPLVHVPDAMLDLIAHICTAFEVDGLRADIVTYKAAATLAAYAGRQVVTVEDVRQAAELALPHRRRRQPFDQPGLDRQQLDEVVDTFSREDPPSDSPPPPRSDPPPRRDPSGGSDLPRPAQADTQTVFDAAAAPDFQLPTATPTRRQVDPTSTQSRRRASLVSGARGRHIRSVATPAGAIDVLATLRQTAMRQNVRAPQNATRRRRPRREDLRFKLRAAPVGTLTVFVVDASGSMAARKRMALAKGAILRLLLRAYQSRDEVALVAFRGVAADVLLPPTSSVHLASTRLRELPTGGRTPLALALHTAARLLHHANQRRATRSRRLVLISDGRANVPLIPRGDAYADALNEARALRAGNTQAVLIDSEDGPVRLHRAAALATELGATYLRLAPA